MLVSVEDKDLVKGLQQNDRKSFDALYYRYYSGVYRNIGKLIYKYEVAEDILQEVFLALWNNRHAIDPSQSVAGWLFVVSYNKSLKWLKANIREHHLFQNMYAVLSDTDLSSEEMFSSEEETFQAQIDLLQTAINELPHRKKQAFQLCKLEGKSYEEAGHILGISAMTVKEYVKSSSQYIRRSISSGPGYASLAAFTGLAAFAGL